MAADDLSVEYHLTPDGWIKGTSRYFGNIDGKEVDRPADAVETWQERIYQRSIWSPEERSYSMRWHDSDAPEIERIALRGKFPHPFMETPQGF